ILPAASESSTTVVATTSESRAPHTTRASMSRPSASHPSQWPRPGGARTCVRSIASGSIRTSSGPKAAASASMATIAPPATSDGLRRVILAYPGTRLPLQILCAANQANPRINHPVHHVGSRVDDHVAQRESEHASFDQWIIARAYRGDQQTAHPGPREDYPVDDRAGQKRAGLQAEQRNQWSQRIAQSMTHQRGEGAESFAARGADIIGLAHLDETLAQHPRQDRRQRGSQRHRG